MFSRININSGKSSTSNGSRSTENGNSNIDKKNGKYNFPKFSFKLFGRGKQKEHLTQSSNQSSSNISISSAKLPQQRSATSLSFSTASASQSTNGNPAPSIKEKKFNEDLAEFRKAFAKRRNILHELQDVCCVFKDPKVLSYEEIEKVQNSIMSAVRPSDKYSKFIDGEINYSIDNCKELNKLKEPFDKFLKEQDDLLKPILDKIIPYLHLVGVKWNRTDNGDFSIIRQIRYDAS